MSEDKKALRGEAELRRREQEVAEKWALLQSTLENISQGISVFAEDALRESRETLQAVIDAIPVMINAKDLQSRYIFMNRFQAMLYGISENQAVGKTAAEALGGEYGAEGYPLDSTWPNG